jgi:hypothetical protein
MRGQLRYKRAHVKSENRYGQAAVPGGVWSWPSDSIRTRSAGRRPADDYELG